MKVPLRAGAQMAGVLCYVAYSFLLAVACYLRPVPNVFDCYVYEALIRSSRQTTKEIYAIVKHESPRSEGSAFLDSPEDLAQLEPKYAIRPLYIKFAELLTRAGLPPQQALLFISAASLFLISLLTLTATRSYIFSVLLTAMPQIVILGRAGLPDALSSLVVAAGCFAILEQRLFPAILLLMISVWVRTDNVLFVVLLLGWLAWNQKIPPVYAAVLGFLAAVNVKWINYWSGNYGWKSLLYATFVNGRHPAEITSGITLSQYFHAFFFNAESLIPQLSVCLVLAVAAWYLGNNCRGLLAVTLVSCLLHYVLFPSPESRYFSWALLVVGIVFVRELRQHLQQQTIGLSTSRTNPASKSLFLFRPHLSLTAISIPAVLPRS